MKEALIIVDVQNDFCPGGSLAVPNGDRIIPALNSLIKKFEKDGKPVFFTRDWHPGNHISFAEREGPWPPHCVAGTNGAEFHPDLQVSSDSTVVSKAMDADADAYSGFQGTDLDDHLRSAGIERLIVGGLATDYCVKATVLDALEMGYAVTVVSDGIAAVEVASGDGKAAMDEMVGFGALIASSGEVEGA